MNIAHVKAVVKPAEGKRALVYDDATGRPVRRGDVIKGNLTVGYGHNLMENPLSDQVLDLILEEDLGEVVQELDAHASWWRSLDDVRQDAILELTFEMGLAGLLEFKKMIGYLQDKRWVNAAYELEASRFPSQVGPTRFARIQKMILDGIDPIVE